MEPENRLVARTLEAAWERKLAALRELSDEHERYLRRQPRALSGEERAEIRRLAADLPALWSAPSTTDADRKEVLRQVVEEVVVTVEGRTEWCEARVRWAGSSSSPTGSGCAGGSWSSKGRAYRRGGSPSGSMPRGCARPTASRSRRRSRAAW